MEGKSHKIYTLSDYNFLCLNVRLCKYPGSGLVFLSLGTKKKKKTERAMTEAVSLSPFLGARDPVLFLSLSSGQKF